MQHQHRTETEKKIENSKKNDDFKIQQERKCKHLHHRTWFVKGFNSGHKRDHTQKTLNRKR